MTKKQKIEEKIKMLENGKAATEQMTDEECAEIYGIPKNTCLTRSSPALQFPTLSAWRTGATLKPA